MKAFRFLFIDALLLFGLQANAQTNPDIILPE